MKKNTQNLIRLASSLQEKYLKKTATSDQDLKTIIADQSSSGRYIPLVRGKDFVSVLRDINRNASIGIKFGTEDWYDIISAPKFFVTPFSFEEGTSEEEMALFKNVPDGIRKFLNAQGSKMGIQNGEWTIVFP